MAYEKQQWVSGDIITAEKLNHMEDGIDEAGFNESNLPIAESLGSGDKLRIVTADGASKQIGANSIGGAEVEVIQIATISGTFKELQLVSSSDSDHNVYYFGGGGLLQDEKTLSELVGNKKIIDLFGVAPTSDGNTTLMLTGRGHSLDLRLEPPSEYSSITGMSAVGLSVGVNVPTNPVSVYAICI